MRVSRFFVLMCLLLVAALLFGQSDITDFNKFFATFKAAAAAKDRSALVDMMATHFDYFQARDVDPETVFKQLGEENGKQWANLQQAVRNQPGELQGGYFGQPARAVRCIPTNDAYFCWVVFTQNEDGEWRWRAMVMPARVRNLPIPPTQGPKPKK